MNPQQIADLPTLHDSHLPASDNVWEKVRQDLLFGYKIHGTPPYFTEVIRVYTKHPDADWEFLVIATANTTNLQVYALEIHAYKDNKSWRLNLRHHPLTKPQWKHDWIAITDNYPDDEPPTQDFQKHIIHHYLGSTVDIDSTRQSYHRLSYPKHKLSWITPPPA